MSNEIHLITVGKLKHKELEKVEQDYLKRFKSPKLYIHEVKAKAENKKLEGKEVIKKIQDLSQGSTVYSIVLSEWGKEYTSIDFSKKVFKLLESNKLIFIICGAEGPSNELLDYTQDKISLSKLTFPHKIARILFIEQIYRAITIQNNHPYHN